MLEEQAFGVGAEKTACERPHAIKAVASLSPGSVIWTWCLPVMVRSRGKLLSARVLSHSNAEPAGELATGGLLGESSNEFRLLIAACVISRAPGLVDALGETLGSPVARTICGGFL